MRLCFCLALLLPFAGASAPLPAAAQAPTGDSSAVAGVVGAFHAALAAGDSTGALALLADDAVILESGGVETRAEYRAHHLPADIAFAAAVAAQRRIAAVNVHQDVAWVSSTSVARGQFRERAVNSAGAELMVLVRTPAGWRIAAIHWSARPLRE